MYPLYPGRAEMVLSSPVFQNVKFERPNGNILIHAPNAAPENIFVQSLKINDKPSNNSWLPERFLKTGGTLDFVLSDNANVEWGIGEDNTPPSFSVKNITKK